MKLREKEKAIVLRKRGLSITKIADELRVSKGSVSNWVRNVRLSSKVIKEIKKRSHSAAAVEARRQSRLVNENKKRSIAINKASASISALAKHDLFLVGVALYWGEGSKRKRGVVEFTNSDPKMIVVMKRFLIECCLVKPSKLRGHVYIHQHLNVNEAEKYWSDISGIPRDQFHKTSIQKNKNRIKKDTLPNGTFAMLVCDTQLKLKMDGWIEGLYKAVNRSL